MLFNSLTIFTIRVLIERTLIMTRVREQEFYCLEKLEIVAFIFIVLVVSIIVIV